MESDSIKNFVKEIFMKKILSVFMALVILVPNVKGYAFVENEVETVYVENLKNDEKKTRSLNDLLKNSGQNLKDFEEKTFFNIKEFYEGKGKLIMFTACFGIVGSILFIDLCKNCFCHSSQRNKKEMLALTYDPYFREREMESFTETSN